MDNMDRMDRIDESSGADAHAPHAQQAGQTAEVVRSEERLHLDTVSEVVGRVRVAKRVVTEERVVTVSVRREELVVEELPVDLDRPTGSLVVEASEVSADGTRGAAPVVEMWLSEEEVEVHTRIVPKRRVRVFVDTVTEMTEVSGTVDREVVEVVEVDG
jgi:stress response protein YsnF